MGRRNPHAVAAAKRKAGAMAHRLDRRSADRKRRELAEQIARGVAEYHEAQEKRKQERVP